MKHFFESFKQTCNFGVINFVVFCYINTTFTVPAFDSKYNPFGFYSCDLSLYIIKTSGIKDLSQALKFVFTFF